MSADLLKYLLKDLRDNIEQLENLGVDQAPVTQIEYHSKKAYEIVSMLEEWGGAAIATSNAGLS